MTTEGGATVGYCAMGRLVIATPPKTTMNSAITQAKIGLSMKKRGMTVPLSARGSGGGGRGGLWRARRPWHGLDGGLGVHHLLEAVDHDLLTLLEAAEHDPLGAT